MWGHTSINTSWTPPSDKLFTYRIQTSNKCTQRRRREGYTHVPPVFQARRSDPSANTGTWEAAPRISSGLGTWWTTCRFTLPALEQQTRYCASTMRFWLKVIKNAHASQEATHQKVCARVSSSFAFGCSLDFPLKLMQICGKVKK